MHDHCRVSPLILRRRLVFGVDIGAMSWTVRSDVMLSVFLGDAITCCRGGRFDVVRGSRLLLTTPDPLATLGSAAELPPSLLVGLYGVGPLATLPRLASRSK